MQDDDSVLEPFSDYSKGAYKLRIVENVAVNLVGIAVVVGAWNIAGSKFEGLTIGLLLFIALGLHADRCQRTNREHTASLKAAHEYLERHGNDDTEIRRVYALSKKQRLAFVVNHFGMIIIMGMTLAVIARAVLK